MGAGLRGASFCSGVGGLDLAAEMAGVEVVMQVEIDPKCQRVLRQHWPEVPLYGDMRRVVGNEIAGVDVWFGGIPCQPFSVLGKQRGRFDPRDLWPDAIRIIRRMQPAWVVIENVANFANIALDRVSADLERAGYEVRAFVLPACAFGAPHQRERTFTLAHAAARGLRLGAPPGQGGLAALGGEGDGRGFLESALDRAVDGISDQLDPDFFPVRRGRAQRVWEAPRAVPERIDGRGDRLRQLGNAVVWVQAYPIFALIAALDAALRQTQE